MNTKSKLILLATTLCLLIVAPLYATSPQKSTIITINGDDVGKPPVCGGEITCELRSEGIDFIYAHGSERVVILDPADKDAACAAGKRSGIDLTIIAPDGESDC